MNIHELAYEFCNQKLRNQPFLVKGKIDLVVKLIENIMLSKAIEAFENYLEAIYEHCDDESTIIKEAIILIETDEKLFYKVKQK